MVMTIEEIRKWLDPEEVDYPQAAAQLGPEALPNLEELVRSSDSMLASKAVYLASLIHGERAVRILEHAIGRPEGAVRVAAAAGLKHLNEDEAGRLAERLLTDQDIGVRKTAIKSISAFSSPAIQQKLQRTIERDPEPSIREFATRLLDASAIR